MKNIQYYNAEKYADKQYEVREHGVFHKDGEYYISSLLFRNRNLMREQIPHIYPSIH